MRNIQNFTNLPKEDKLSLRKFIYFFKKLVIKDIFFFLLLGIVIFLLYGKSINYELLNLDDNTTISSNIEYISDIKNLPTLFVKDAWCSNDGQGYYRPVLIISYAIEAVLFGLNPKVNHLTNLILFILSVYLMYVFLIQLKQNKIITMFVLLLVIVSPVFTSVPVWIAARNDSLLTIFVILCLINIFNFFTKEKFGYLLLSLLFFAMALFTKESVFVLIVIIPIFLCSVDKFNVRNFLKLYICCLIPLIIYFIFRNYSQISNYSFFNLNNFNIFLKNSIFGFVIYINKLLVPSDVPVCLFNYIPDTLSIIKAIAFFILLIACYIKNFINRKLLIFGLSVFILFLIPTFFVIQDQIYQIFFHRLLLPALGIILIFILLIEKFIELFPISKKYFVFLFLVLFFVFCYGSYIQADKYENNDIFIINGYKDAPAYPMFFVTFHVNQARSYYKVGDYKKALELYMELLKKDNTEAQYYYSIGLLYYKLNNKKAAVDYINKAIDLDKTNDKYLKFLDELST